MKQRETYRDGSGESYTFIHAISSPAMAQLREAKLSCAEVMYIDNTLVGMGLEQVWVKGIWGSFEMMQGKICFFPIRINGQTAEEVLQAYQVFPGKCALCHQLRSAHYVVKSEIEDGWTIRCPGKG